MPRLGAFVLSNYCAVIYVPVYSLFIKLLAASRAQEPRQIPDHQRREHRAGEQRERGPKQNVPRHKRHKRSNSLLPSAQRATCGPRRSSAR